MDEELFAFAAEDVERISASVRNYEGTSQRRFPLANPAQDRNYAKVFFRNDNAGTAPAYGVLRVTGVTTIDQFGVLTVDQPTSTFQWLYLVNGPEDVVTNGYGWGTWLWHGGRVLYDTGTPALGGMWGAKASQWTLSVNRPGFYILGGNDTTLTTTLAVQMPPQEILLNNASGSDIAAASSGTFTIYGGASGGEATLSMTLTAYNRSSIAFKNGKYGAGALINGQVYAVPWQT